MSYFGMLFASETVLRLLLAAVLGCVIGLERAAHRKPAGLRTIMFISFGSALFTVVSEGMGKMHNADPTRIAAQLVTGIGFLGAGSILHARGAVVGLTTAATIFVMASVGMACGAGLYWIAVFSTVVLLAGLLGMRWLEKKLKWRARLVTYTVTTRQLGETIAELNQALDAEQLAMQHIRCHHFDGMCTVEFSPDVPQELERNLIERFGKLRTVLDIGHSERMEAAE